MVYKYRLLGLPQAKIIELFYVDDLTFYHWLNEIPEFRQAWHDGKEGADATVAHSLFQRANGYSHPAEKIFYDRDIGRIVRAQTTEHYPPDTSAAIFWLTNRNKAYWQSKNTTELTGADGTALAPPMIVINPVFTTMSAAPSLIDQSAAELPQENVPARE